jgi:RNA polymerase subunit RPABC4/transcription elongation factor Spt4
MARTRDHSACPSCAARLPRDASFCPKCGTRSTAGETLELPLDVVSASPEVAAAPGESPPMVYQVQRRPLGIDPVPLLGGAGGVALLVAIILFASGSSIGGVIVLILSLALLTLFFAAVERQPETRTAQATRIAVDRVRSLLRLAAVTALARSHAGLGLLRIRRRQQRIRSQLQGRLKPLGEAVHQGDHRRAELLKQQATELERRLGEAELEASAVLGAARTEIGRERRTVEPTQALALAEAEHRDERTDPPHRASNDRGDSTTSDASGR